MPLESAEFIHQLNISNPVPTDPTGAADDHLRLIKGAIKATFPNIAGAVTASHADINKLAQILTDITGLNTQVGGLRANLVPKGAIVMWSGKSASDIPVGWKLCDGTDGTPDLREKFIAGAATLDEVGTTGGSFNAAITIAEAGGHTHTGVTAETTLTVAQLPAHSHGTAGTGSGGTLIQASGNSYGNTNNYLLAPGGAGAEFSSSTVGGGNPHAHAITLDGRHTHTGTVSTPPPPYYALAFIIKVV
ncbi:MAG: hypothetical protein J0H82_06725 [Alphaproteobacteria bacterium]|jgi:hypothetical protein|nr:hypothetical protein [Alphaproteobacteria bacterium]